MTEVTASHKKGGGGQQADTWMLLLETMDFTFCRVI